MPNISRVLTEQNVTGFSPKLYWSQNLKFHKTLNELIDINVLFDQGICILFNIQVIIIYPIEKYRNKSVFFTADTNKGVDKVQHPLVITQY